MVSSASTNQVLSQSSATTAVMAPKLAAPTGATKPIQIHRDHGKQEVQTISRFTIVKTPASGSGSSAPSSPVRSSFATTPTQQISPVCSPNFKSPVIVHGVAHQMPHIPSQPSLESLTSSGVDLVQRNGRDSNCLLHQQSLQYISASTGSSCSLSSPVQSPKMTPKITTTAACHPVLLRGISVPGTLVPVNDRLVNNKRGNSLPNIDLPVVAPNSSPNTTTYVTCTHQNVNSTVPQQMHTVPSSNKSSAVARQQVLNTLLEEGQKRPNVADDFSQPLRYTYVAAKPTMVTYCEEQPPQEPQFRMVYTGTSPLRGQTSSQSNQHGNPQDQTNSQTIKLLQDMAAHQQGHGLMLQSLYDLQAKTNMEIMRQNADIVRLQSICAHQQQLIGRLLSSTSSHVGVKTYNSDLQVSAADGRGDDLTMALVMLDIKNETLMQENEALRSRLVASVHRQQSVNADHLYSSSI